MKHNHKNPADALRAALETFRNRRARADALHDAAISALKRADAALDRSYCARARADAALERLKSAQDDVINTNRATREGWTK